MLLSLLGGAAAAATSVLTSGTWGGDVNILFLMCDSMDGRVVDPTSPVSARVATPTFDALAAKGVNFVNTYCASPQCVPSRTTMLAGRRSDQTRTFSNGNGFGMTPTGGLDKNCVEKYSEATCKEWGANQQLAATFFDSLDAQGMEVAVYGKVDVGGGVLQAYPNATADGFHSGPALGIVTRSADIRRATKPNPMNITNDHDQHVHPEDWAMIDKCMEWLHAKGKDTNTNNKKPWFLYCSLNIPHPPFDTNSTWLAAVNNSLVEVPEWPDNATEAYHPFDSYMTISKAVDGSFTDEQILEVRRTYYAMVAETDYMMGLVIQACKDAKLYDNTVVIFLSDHGEMNMEHRQVWKNSMYEASARVPLIISGGQKAREALGMETGKVVKNLTNLLDVFPTLMALAGSAEPRNPSPNVSLAGYSLSPLFSTTAPVPKEAHANYTVSQYFSNMGNTAAFMLRQGRYKYIAFGNCLDTFTEANGYIPQLFDLEADPEELHDIAKANPDVCARLDKLLRQELSSGTNVVSAEGDYQQIDRTVKVQQQGLYQQYFNTSSGLAQTWQAFVDCVAEGPLPYEKDPDREASCLPGTTVAEVKTSTTDAQKLRKLFEHAYNGFDDTDWAKVVNWISQQP